MGWSSYATFARPAHSRHQRLHPYLGLCQQNCAKSESCCRRTCVIKSDLSLMILQDLPTAATTHPCTPHPFPGRTMSHHMLATNICCCRTSAMQYGLVMVLLVCNLLNATTWGCLPTAAAIPALPPPYGM